ncbi:hypothetical protein PR048_014086 [Dryococelus australis]|uniref:Uncharacterized protein n=1 Tax=Dryococelus australis TaxID=614101 RepID=A0ABQ9HU11_9NEOP|nr:hypothetical protein PR048_014086 [Dryococelus australis]
MMSAERRAVITTVTCMVAIGNFVPPLFVFPRKNMKAELMDGTFTGSLMACHISGWIQIDIFSKLFDSFVKFTNPTGRSDGHHSHTQNIEVIEKTSETWCLMICKFSPMHC